MAEKIIFEIGVNGADGVKTIAQLKDELFKLKKEASTTDVGSAAFKTLQTNIAGVNGELKNLNQGFKAIDAKNIAPVANTMASIKAEVKALKAELEGKQLGSKEFDELQAKLQTANAKFREFKEDIKGFKPEELLKGVASIGATIAGSFSLATGVLAAFGSESKAVAEAEKKAQAAIAIAVGASTIVREVDNASKLVAYGQSKLLTASLFLEKTATEGGTGSRVAATVAQKALNFAMASNPIGAVLVAVVAITGAFIAFAGATDRAAEAQKAFNKANEDNAKFDKIFLEQLEKSAELTRANYARRIVELEGIKGKEEELAQVKKSSAEFEARIQKAISENVRTNDEYNKSVQATLDLNAQKQNNADKDAQKLADDFKNRKAEEDKFLKDSLARNKKYKDDLKKVQQGDLTEAQQIYADRLTAIDDLNATISAKEKEITDNTILNEQQKNALLKKLAEEKKDDLNKIEETANAELLALSIKGAEESAAAQAVIDKQALENKIAGEIAAKEILNNLKLDAVLFDKQLKGETQESIQAEYEARVAIAEDSYKQDLKNAGDNLALQKAAYEKFIQELNQLDQIRSVTSRKLDALDAQAKFAATAEVSKALAGLAKKGSDEHRALTLVSIGLNTAAGLAGAVAAGAGKVWPENLAAIASGILAVLAGITQAKEAFASSGAGYAKGGVIGKYDNGGMIYGAGTSTSDSIPAMLSNGESVINARSTAMYAPLLSQINQAGGGRAFADGGIVSTSFQTSSGGISVASNSPQLDRISELLEISIAKTPTVKTYVVDSDMTEAQSETETIQRRARLF